MVYFLSVPVLNCLNGVPGTNLERWLSGRKRLPAKKLYGQKLYREFESLPLRHFINLTAFELSIYETGSTFMNEGRISQSRVHF